MPQTLKVQRNTLPQIDAIMEQDQSVKFANILLDKVTRFYTLAQIAAHIGVSTRLLSYMRKRGIDSYGNQILLEIMCGEKELVE